MECEHMQKKTCSRLLALLLSIVIISLFYGCGKASENTQTETAEENQIFTQPQSTAEETNDTSAAEKETRSTKAETTETESQSEEETTETTTQQESSSTVATSAAQTTEDTQVTENAQENAAQEETIIENVEQQAQNVQADNTIQETVQAVTQAVTEASTEAPAETVAIDPSALTISYKGQNLTIGDSAEAFVNAVKPDFEESAPSCYGNGENINYYYDDITIYVWNENENYLTYSIDINAPGIAALDDYDVGMQVDFDNEKIIDCGNGYKIILIAIDKKIISISYNKDL